MKLKMVSCLIPMIIAIVVGTAGPAAAAYHYVENPTTVTHDGITFSLMVEYDYGTNHVRAEGRIVSSSGLGGRINWIHLFLNHSGAHDLLANYTPPGGLATNTSVSGYVGPVDCNISTAVYYQAEMSIHEDGTSWTTTMKTPGVDSPCAPKA